MELQYSRVCVLQKINVGGRNVKAEFLKHYHNNRSYLMTHYIEITVNKLLIVQRSLHTRKWLILLELFLFIENVLVV